ncbi:unnamed protein product [Pieris brassicae]|uniref:Uncharacterized protein n=1 Tax=Pieris brassicae TaxID=7116 RepID=A0A9P0TJW0_PIEBR|nr:unnamed protein product [Pieris brassicae]
MPHLRCNDARCRSARASQQQWLRLNSAFAMDKYKCVALSVVAAALRQRITLPPASSLVRRSVETSRATTQRSSGACYKKYMKNDAATTQRSATY